MRKLQRREWPTIVDEVPLGETAGVVTRNPALFAPLKPREKGVLAVSSAGGGAPIDVKLLESNGRGYDSFIKTIAAAVGRKMWPKGFGVR